jgi:hypothetical protein
MRQDDADEEREAWREEQRRVYQLMELVASQQCRILSRQDEMRADLREMQRTFTRASAIEGGAVRVRYMVHEPLLAEGEGEPQGEAHQESALEWARDLWDAWCCGL